jgi:hypothetical protein
MMDAIPSNALGWLRASLFIARFYAVVGAGLIGVFRHVSNDAQVAVLVSYAAATVLLFVGGVTQLFTVDRPRASLNLVVSVFAVMVLACLLPVLAT